MMELIDHTLIIESNLGGYFQRCRDEREDRYWDSDTNIKSRSLHAQTDIQPAIDFRNEIALSPDKRKTTMAVDM